MSAPARAFGRLALAALAALLVWLAFGADAWNRGVVAGTELLLRTFESPSVTRLDLGGSDVEVHRIDMGEDSDVPAFDVAAFTAPCAVLLALLWGGGRLVPRRGAWRGLAALGILFGAQVLHLALAVETLYATQLGAWSAAAYPRWQRELLAAGRSGFDLVLAWTLPVALWIAFYGMPGFRAKETADAAARPRRKRSKK